MEQRLRRKDVLRLYDIRRSTLNRWEHDGCPIVDGWTTESRLAFWHEVRDACKILGMSAAVVMGMPRDAIASVLTAAHEAKRA